MCGQTFLLSGPSISFGIDVNYLTTDFHSLFLGSFCYLFFAFLFFFFLRVLA